MSNLEWKSCKELGSYFAVDTYEEISSDSIKIKKYLLCQPMLKDGSMEGDDESSGQVEECPEGERKTLEALFPNDLEAVKSVTFY